MLCLIFDKCTRELEVGTLTLNFTYYLNFILFQYIVIILFSQLICVYNKYLILIQTCFRIIESLKNANYLYFRSKLTLTLKMNSV